MIDSSWLMIIDLIDLIGLIDGENLERGNFQGDEVENGIAREESGRYKRMEYRLSLIHI